MKKQVQDGECFQFPESKEDIYSFPTLKALRKCYQDLYAKRFESRSKCGWQLNIISKLKKLTISLSIQPNLQEWQVFVEIQCSKCTSKIEYGKKKSTGQYLLLKMKNHHIHISSLEKYFHFLSKRKTLVIFLRQFWNGGLGKKKNFWPKLADYNYSNEEIYNAIMNFPASTTNSTKIWIMKKNFGMSTEQIAELRNRMNRKYDISFRELLHTFENRAYFYRYLPTDLLMKETLESGAKINPEQAINSINPDLPNILVIVTPEMMEQYKNYGQIVGFDLTFSLVSERTHNNGEYMLGVFAGSNACKRIVIFGLVITNSQSIFAYQYIFRQFFQIMGSVPEVIVTDEEKAIHYSLKRLKDQGIFTGTHLFDMFHMLRKFRKGNTDKSIFTLFRTLIHAKNRFQYRKIFKQLLKSASNEKQLELIRNFDLNSHRYCYAQIDPKFVGIGVSNSFNEYFHFIIKSQIPYATKYIKVVQMVLELISRRYYFAKQILLMRKNFESVCHMSCMKQIKHKVSQQVYSYIFKEISRSPTHIVLSSQQEEILNLSFKAVRQRENRLDRNHYYVKSEDQYFRVQKQQLSSKWRCQCKLQERSGYICSHIFAVTNILNLDLSQNIHQRWLLDYKSVEEGITNKNLYQVKLRRSIESKMYYKKQQNNPTASQNILEGFQENSCINKNKDKIHEISDTQDASNQDSSSEYENNSNHRDNSSQKLKIPNIPETLKIPEEKKTQSLLVEEATKQQQSVTKDDPTKITNQQYAALPENVRKVHRLLKKTKIYHRGGVQLWLYPTKNIKVNEVQDMMKQRITRRRTNY